MAKDEFTTQREATVKAARAKELQDRADERKFKKDLWAKCGPGAPEGGK